MGWEFVNSTGQAKIVEPAAVTKPDSIASGEVPVWSGTGWVRSSTTRIVNGGSTLPSITVSAWTGGPPGSPTDGDIWIATLTYSGTPFRWQFQYDSTQATYKWVFCGGSHLGANSGSTYSNSLSATFQIPGSFGFTASRAGTYIVYTQAEFINGTGVAVEAAVSASVNGVGGIGVYADNSAIPNGQSVMMNTTTDTGVVSAGQVIDAAYYSSSIAGSHNWVNRSFWLIPKQVI